MKNRLSIKMIVVVLSLLCLGAGFGYYLLYGSIMANNRRIGAQTEDIAKKTLAENRLISLRKIGARVRGKQETLVRYVVRDDKVVDFIQSIETFGSGVGVTVDVSSLSEEAPPGTALPSLELLKLQIVARGTWEGLFRLLLFFESMPFATQLEHIQLKQSGADAAGASLWNGFFSVTALKEK